MTSRSVTVVNPLGLHARAAARGTTIIISAEGADERAAVDALAELVQTGFGEATWSA